MGAQSPREQGGENAAFAATSVNHAYGREIAGDGSVAGGGSTSELFGPRSVERLRPKVIRIPLDD